MPGVGHRWLDPTEEVRPQKTLRIRAKQLYWGRNVQGSQTRRLRGPPGGCTARVRRTAAVWLQRGREPGGQGFKKEADSLLQGLISHVRSLLASEQRIEALTPFFFNIL